MTDEAYHVGDDDKQHDGDLVDCPICARMTAIEECARVADSYEEAEFGYNPTAVKIAAAIRALKSDTSR